MACSFGWAVQRNREGCGIDLTRSRSREGLDNVLLKFPWMIRRAGHSQGLPDIGLVVVFESCVVKTSDLEQSLHISLRHCQPGSLEADQLTCPIYPGAIRPACSRLKRQRASLHGYLLARVSLVTVTHAGSVHLPACCQELWLSDRSLETTSTRSPASSHSPTHFGEKEASCTVRSARIVHFDLGYAHLNVILFFRG